MFPEGFKYSPCQDCPDKPCVDNPFNTDEECWVPPVDKFTPAKIQEVPNGVPEVHEGDRVSR